MLYTYDSYQRVTMVQRYLWLNGIRAEDMCERETYSYDTNPFDATFSQKPSGRLTAVQYGGTRSGCSGTIFTEMYSYTPSGHITAKRLRVNKGNNNADLNASFTYNNEGALSSVTYPNGGPTFTYGFDTMGRPISLADNQTTPVTWVNGVGYAADDQLTQIARWNGSAYWTESRTYNAPGQMTRQTVHGTFDQEYRFSATQNNGKTTQSKDWIANQEVTYTYDALGRLTAARTTDPSQWGLSWAYDGFGIRLSQAVTQGSAPVSNLLVDAATNRISTSGFGYDANGNLTLQPSNITMAYDVENRLTSYNGQISYGYAPDNKRVWTSGPPEVVYFYGPNGEATGTYQVVVNAGVLSLTTRDTSLDFAGVALQRQSKTVLVDRLSSVRQWGSTGSNYFPYGEEQVTTAQGRAKFGLDYFGG